MSLEREGQENVAGPSAPKKKKDDRNAALEIRRAALQTLPVPNLPHQAQHDSDSDTEGNT